MRCATCDHALWKTVGRTCPECGTPFRPSEFTFRPSAVAFRCPHCAQDYYGTDARGLLEPTEFDCVRCGRHVHLDEMVLEPAEGRSEDETGPRPNPWAERIRIGLLRAWWRSVVQILFRPTGFGASLPPRYASASGFGFMLLCLVPQAILGIAAMLLMLMPMMLAGPGPGPAGFLAAQSFFAFGSAFVLVPVALLGGLLAHATLVLLGARGTSLSRSVGCGQFAAGATSLVGFVPCVSCIPFVPVIWWFASFRLMLAAVHRCPRWKAAIAALVPLALMMSVSVAAIVVPFMITTGITPGMVVRAQGVAVASLHRVNLGETMRRFELDRGRPCATPIELLIERPELAVDLARLVAPDRPDAASIGGRTIMSGLATAEEARAAHESLLARLPAGPYRLGNLVLLPPGHPLEGQFGVRDPFVGDVWITTAAHPSGVLETVEVFVFPPGIDFDALPDLLDPAPQAPGGG